MASITKRVLIIAPQWIGDAVMTEPLVNDWAQSGFEVSVAALPHIAPVFRAMQGVEHVVEWSFERKKIELNKRLETARHLRGHFEVCVVCPNSFKTALIPWFARIPERVGYVGELRRWLLTKALPNPYRNHRGSMVGFYKALGPPHTAPTLARANKKSTDERALDVPHLHVEEALIQKAISLHHLIRGEYTVIAPGAEYGPAKRWPIEYFAELGHRVCETGGTVVILGGSADRVVAEQIKIYSEEKAQELTGKIQNLAGETLLSEAIALIAGAKCIVSNDSGLMHIGAALRVPQVAIFGSSSPLHTPPLSAQAKVLWLSLPCAPCFKRICPLGHTNCLKGITVGQVEEAVQSCLTL